MNKVLELKMTVKVPSGMTEADLARPVVVINDFETGKLEYEIYSYGEQTVVIPVQEGREKSSAHKLAETAILSEFQKYSRNAEVEVLPKSGSQLRQAHVAYGDGDGDFDDNFADELPALPTDFT